MKDIFFVRHAESESNVDGIQRGPTTALTEKGINQAEIVAERVAKLGVEALVASPYHRTQHTAERISEKIGLPIEICDLFTERRNPSARLGRTLDAEIKGMMHEVFVGYTEKGHRFSDEENFEDLRARANRALAFLTNYPKDKVCVVTHGVFLRILLCAAVNGPEFTGRDMQNFMKTYETGNTGIFWFQQRVNHWTTSDEDPMAWYVMSWNDLAHLG